MNLSSLSDSALRRLRQAKKKEKAQVKREIARIECEFKARREQRKNQPQGANNG